MEEKKRAKEQAQAEKEKRKKTMDGLKKRLSRAEKQVKSHNKKHKKTKKQLKQHKAMLEGHAAQKTHKDTAAQRQQQYVAQYMNEYHRRQSAWQMSGQTPPPMPGQAMPNDHEHH